MQTALKALYRSTVPDRIRYRLGRFRRNCLDSARRWRTPGPLPPRELLQYVQMTPWVAEYLRVGELSHRALSQTLQAHGLEKLSHPSVLDFGCGLGRTLRFFPTDAWKLSGCDVDPRLIDWTRDAFPAIDIRLNASAPPLPWPDQSFDGLWAVSVFTHFPAPEQEIWASELARLLRPGGLAAITTMGPHALTGFPNLNEAKNRQTLGQQGFFFHASGSEFNANGAFHTAEGIGSLFEEKFDLMSWMEGGLDGFQDLAILRRFDEP